MEEEGEVVEEEEEEEVVQVELPDWAALASPGRLLLQRCYSLGVLASPLEAECTASPSRLCPLPPALQPPPLQQP